MAGSNLVAFIPKIALVLVVIIGGLILLEIIQILRDRKTKNKTGSPDLKTPPVFADMSMPSENLPNLATTTPPPAFTAVESVPPKVPSSASGKRKFALLGVVVFLLLVIPAGVYLALNRQEIRKEAFTGTPGGDHDSCNLLTITVNEFPSCPRLANQPNPQPTPANSNNISDYNLVVHLTGNTLGGEKIVKYQALTYYCDEPYGRDNGAGNVHCDQNMQQTVQTITVPAGEEKNITINRASGGASACGSYQADFKILSITYDGQEHTECNYTGSNNTSGAWGFCQTGLSCNAPTVTPTVTTTPPVTPTVTVTPPPTRTPTPTTIPNRCVLIKVYKVIDQQWVDWTNQLTQLAAGDQVYLAVAGEGPVNAAQFRVNGQLIGSGPVSTRNPFQEFYVPYVIPAGINSFKFEGQVLKI